MDCIERINQIQIITIKELEPRRQIRNFWVTKNSNCNFNGNPVDAGVNFRAMSGTQNASYAVTIKSSMSSDFSDYLAGFAGSVWTLTLKVNLNSKATKDITFSGNIYF